MNYLLSYGVAPDVYEREIELGGPLDGRVSAETNESEIPGGTQESALGVERKKNRVAHNSADFPWFVYSAVVVAAHQWTRRVGLAAKNRLPLMRQLSEAHVDADRELALELGRNGRLELDRAVGVSVGEQFVQATRKLEGRRLDFLAPFNENLKELLVALHSGGFQGHGCISDGNCWYRADLHLRATTGPGRNGIFAGEIAEIADFADG